MSKHDVAVAMYTGDMDANMGAGFQDGIGYDDGVNIRLKPGLNIAVCWKKGSEVLCDIMCPEGEPTDQCIEIGQALYDSIGKFLEEDGSVPSMKPDFSSLGTIQIVAGGLNLNVSVHGIFTPEMMFIAQLLRRRPYEGDVEVASGGYIN